MPANILVIDKHPLPSNLSTIYPSGGIALRPSKVNSDVSTFLFNDSDDMSGFVLVTQAENDVGEVDYETWDAVVEVWRSMEPCEEEAGEN